MRITLIFLCFLLVQCSKQDTNPVQAEPVLPPENFSLNAITVNGLEVIGTIRGVGLQQPFHLKFTGAVKKSTINAILLNAGNGESVPYSANYQNGDSTVVIQPTTALAPLTRYNITVSTGLQSTRNTSLSSTTTISFVTAIDSTNKFPAISDTALVELVQRQTFRYFWDFAHPGSGMARERNTSGDLVTSGGSGFGVMAILVGIHRSFISRAEGLARVQKIVVFLKEKARRFHGAYPHWLNGNDGSVIPFSAKDNGADLVETSLLMQGLLCARQFFSGQETGEVSLRADINTIWDGVEWSWFRKNNENVLYWHWSPDFAWDINLQVRGWNEALITYVLAASSRTYGIPKTVYDNGWAGNGAIRNGNVYYGLPLPLGPNLGGPLFFEHYSFLGINPFGLTDAYANYQVQTVNHTRINHEYVKSNPKNYYGYSNVNWGLTASDIPNGYTASSPTDDVGVIAPTAALSSFPYTPTLSMEAMKFFYYKLGDRLWGEYGFRDAFSLHEPWFAGSYLAIDQGPIVIMLENYRSGLMWHLFMSCPEVKAGMRSLGFQSPHL
jgi:hypothetical protein